jgi:hypothetical protein
MTDVGLVYGACRERISELVGDLDDERAAQRVAATPEWSVHDVVALLVGILTEINAEKADGVGSLARTARQVADRHDVAIEVLLAEWDRSAPQFEKVLTRLGGPCPGDLRGRAPASAASSGRRRVGRTGYDGVYTFVGPVVLEAHGWEDLQPELNRLSKDGRWDVMASLIDDEMLNTFAVVAPPDKVASIMTSRYGELVDRIAFNAPYRSDPTAWAETLAGFR